MDVNYHLPTIKFLMYIELYLCFVQVPIYIQSNFSAYHVNRTAVNLQWCFHAFTAGKNVEAIECVRGNMQIRLKCNVTRVGGRHS